MKHGVLEERLKVPTTQGGHLFVRKLASEGAPAVVLMVHGVGNRGDVFLHEGHGLANYLSEMGFTCLIPDLIGQGQSWPHRSRRLDRGVHAIVNEDLPRLVDEARRIAEGRPLFLVGQGFGGVLIASAYARVAAIREGIAGMIHFASRRSSLLGGIGHGVTGRFVNGHLLPILGNILGEVPLHWSRQSMTAESLAVYDDYRAWSKGSWSVTGENAFDYGAAARQLDWPPSLYLARRNGGYTDHLADVREFMREIGTHNARLLVLGKRDGNLRNYSVLSMLQHDDAWVDHFPVILDWLNERMRHVKPQPRVRHLISV